MEEDFCSSIEPHVYVWGYKNAYWRKRMCDTISNMYIVCMLCTAVDKLWHGFVVKFVSETISTVLMMYRFVLILHRV